MRAPLVTALAAATLVPAFMVLGSQAAVASPASPGGNNGNVKIAEIDDAASPSNDPHVKCTFNVEWYGFDKGADIVSEVQFESQSPTDADITVTGAKKVFVGGDAAGGDKDLDGTQKYTLAFKGKTKDGSFHVKMTAETSGSKGSTKKSKVFWVDACSTPTTDPVPTEDPTPTTEPGEPVTTDPTVTTPTLSPWSWDWTYTAPTCDALTVDYPANIPSGQSNDVNVRFTRPDGGQFTLNFHNNTDTWAGRTIFTFANHPQWPAGLTDYDVVWVQVGGTNYHWQGSACSTSAPTTPASADPAPADPAPADAAPATPVPTFVAPVEVLGFRAGTTSVRLGSAPKADWVSVAATDADAVQVQRLKKGSWKSTSSAAIRSDGTAKVTYPRLTKRGTYKFRVVVDGVATKSLTVKVR